MRIDPLTVTFLGGPQHQRQYRVENMWAIAPGRRIPVVMPMDPAAAVVQPTWVLRGFYELMISPAGWVGYWREPVPDGRV